MGKECSGPANWLDKASIPSSKSTLHNDIPIVPTATFEDALQVLDLEQKDLGPIGKEYVETLRTLNWLKITVEIHADQYFMERCTFKNTNLNPIIRMNLYCRNPMSLYCSNQLSNTLVLFSQSGVQ